MTIKTTRWTTDTCGCVIDYQWDDAVDVSLRVHTASAIVSRCARHAPLGEDLQTHYTRLGEENPRKNRALARLANAFPILTTTDGAGNIILAPGAVSWSFDANHVLQISAPSLTALQKAQAQTWADTNLGVGRAVLA